MKEELRVGLIGCGGMGRSLVSHLKTVEGARLAAVFDKNREQTGGFEDCRVCASEEELLAEVDAVLIAAPQFAHRDLVLAAVAAGRPVFCEKPMALTVADCDEMVAAAEAAGVLLVVGQVLRLNPVYARARLLINEESLGNPLGVTMTRVGPSRELFQQGWRARNELTGGLLFEVNVHELDFMRFLCGEPESVYAQSRRLLETPIDYPDLWHVNVSFREGGMGFLRASLSCYIRENRFSIQCPGGTIANGVGDTGLLLARADGTNLEISREELAQMEPGGRREVRTWVEAIRGEGEPLVTARDGRQAVAMAEAAVKSSLQGGAVPVE